MRRFEREWNTGSPTAGYVVGVVLSAVILAAAGVVAMLLFDMHPALFALAFLASVLGSLSIVGTFNLLRIARAKSGRLVLTCRRFFAFIPVGRKTVDLDDCVEIQFRETGAMEVLAGLTLVTTFVVGFAFYMGTLLFGVMLLGSWRLAGRLASAVGFFAGSIWYAYQSSKVHMTLRLVARRERNSLTLCRGTDETLMREIIAALQEAHDLPLKR